MKINLYNDKKQRIFIKTLFSKYNIRIKNVQYLYCLIEKYSFDTLRTLNNKEYQKYFKREAIDIIIINHKSIWSVALDIVLPGDEILQN